jgi:hypothetical protein
MNPDATTCEHVDVALLMQQLVRDREVVGSGAPTTVSIGDACGRPATGWVELDGLRRHYCPEHVVPDRVCRD